MDLRSAAVLNKIKLRYFKFLTNNKAFF